MSNSVTAKLNKKRLQDALRRRRAARTVTYLLDNSVPTEMRFHGILDERARLGKPVVRVARAHALSPFVIHLNAHLPSPAELLADDRLAAPNLLLPERFFLSVADAERMNPTEDLTLTPYETMGQMREDVETRFEGAKVRMAEEAKIPKFYDHPEAVKAGFSAKPFVPPAMPENFAAYFELPESEEHDAFVEEAENVTFDAATFEMTVPETREEPAEPRVSLWQTLRAKLAAEDEQLTFGFLPLGWHRAIGAFVLVAFVFVLPFHAVSFLSNLAHAKSGLEADSQTALSQLKAGANAVLVRDASAASASFGKADDAFSRAQESVKDLGAVTSLLLSAVPAAGSTYQNGKTLLDAGQSLASAGERISQGFLAAQGERNPTPTSRLEILTTYVSSALPDLKNAEGLVASVDADAVPAEQRDTFLELAARLPTFVSTIEEFLAFSEMAQTILGGDGLKRYLVVFQNNTEMRATGGFMGSFAELDLKDGVIVGMNVPGGGTYDLQGSLKTNLAAPDPLQLLTPRWEFQDANWFPDFPTSARQIMDFYTDGGGGTVDGVIAVNATYVADFIGLLGPVDMPEYGRTITSDNFLLETQKIVELEYDREENKPKAFIGDLAPLLLDRVMHGSAEDFFTVLDRAEQGLSSRDIQIYFSDDALERSIHDLGWGGELKQTAGDYLMIVNTNLGGGKTDAVISEAVDMVVSIDEDGGVTNTVSVTRSHAGEKGATFTGANNVDYVRLYVPQGATLLSATGFAPPDTSLFEFPPDDWKIDDDLLYAMDSLETDEASGTAAYDESGKTVFGNWVQTKPGTATTYSFTYRLPFTLEVEQDNAFMAFAKKTFGVPSTESYSLTVQKQSGILDRTTELTVRAPENRRTVWSSHDPQYAAFGNAGDAFFAAIFERIEL